MTPADEDLVARVLATRDTRAFGELVRRHQSRVRGWLQQLSRDPAVADDLAQDTFVRAWEKLHTFAGRGRFIAWLLKLAHNGFLQYVRKTKRERQVLEAVEAELEMPAESSATGFRGEYPDLPRLLGVLSEDERQVMILSYAYGCSHGEIVTITGMPLGTVKSHISRGKAKIQRRFGLAAASNG